MKSNTAYYLLLVYITVVVKPLLPVVSDWYQHEFNNIEHLACVHAVYGSNHVQHEIAEHGSESDHSTGQNNVKSEDQVPFHILAPENKNENIKVISNLQFNTLQFFKLPSVFIPKDGPPPKFA